jgi:hypothetical protein
LTSQFSPKVASRAQAGTGHVNAERLLALSAIAALAIELRWLFFTGAVHLDALKYALAAQQFLHGLPLEGMLTRWSSVRIGMYGPTAIAYAVFGVGPRTTLAWPFVSSLLGLCAMYGVSRLLAGERAGLLAAFIWAVLPTAVAASTALLGDAPIAALSVATMLFLLMAERTAGRHRLVCYAAAFTAFSLAVLTKILVAIVAPVFLVYLIRRGTLTRAAWAVIAALLAAVLGLYFFATASQEMSLFAASLGWSSVAQSLSQSATRWWTTLIGHRDFFSTAPLCVVAVAVLLALKRREAYLPIAWFATGFLYLQFGTRSPFSFQPLYFDADAPTRHVLFIAAPLVITTGIYLATGASETFVRRVIPFVCTGIGIVAWAGMRHATRLTWGSTGEAMSALPFATLSPLAAAVAIFGGIASPAFVIGSAARWKNAALAVLLVGVGLAALNPSYLAANDFRLPWVQTFPEAAVYLRQHESFPVFVQNVVVGEQLDYSSNFEFGQSTPARPGSGRIRVAPSDPNEIGDAFVLIDDFYVLTGSWGEAPAYFRAPPATWAQVATFGTIKNHQLHIYRVLNQTSAMQAFTAASAEARTSATPATLRSLLNAAVAARQFCDAASAWDELRATAPDQVRSVDPVGALRECYLAHPERSGPNVPVNADFARGTDSWPVHPESQASVSIDEGSQRTGRAWHVNYRGGNWQVINQEILLKPDTPYVYEAELKTTGPVVALYWQAETGRFFADGATYADWTKLTYVFVTPHWNGQPMRTGINPVLMKAPGDAWIRGLRLSELTPRLAAPTGPPR